MSRSKAKRSPEQKQRMQEKKRQREAFETLKSELEDLHDISLYVMDQQGILPPLYGGEHLGPDREVIPLWGWTGDDDLPEIGALLMRVMPDVEPDVDLQLVREDLELENDWPMAELLEMLASDGGKPIDGAESIKDLSIFLMMSGEQIAPAPGYQVKGMIEHVTQMRPYAVFPIVPVTGSGDDVTYQWDDLDHFRAEIVYAESPQMLETAVWEYRLRLALASEAADVLAEGLDPAEELVAVDVKELAALHESLVMHAIRLYGTTSALRSKQQELDVLREENGDLIVKLPLKPEIEPVKFLVEDRSGLTTVDGDVFLTLSGDGDAMRTVWPQIRAKKYFGIRVRFGSLVVDASGTPRLNGYASQPLLEWTVAETLGDLYRMVHYFSLYELLSLSELVVGKLLDIPKASASK